MYAIYLEKGDLNDATAYYIDIIKSAIKLKNDDYCFVSCVKDIKHSDIVIVIQAKSFFHVYNNYNKQKIIIWFQGIVPEEAMLMFYKSYSKYFRFILWRYYEWVALRKSSFNFFVSQYMVDHFNNIYGYNKKNYFLMPCFNLSISNDSFFLDSKYEKPSFVYAGSLSAWQCIERTLLLYKKIETVIVNSSLTLLTNEEDKAKEMIDKFGIRNFTIKYVNSDLLGEELKKYKYGFIIRDNIEVNRVATPTKMNSYLASGIIPIYSNVIEDFRLHFNCKKYFIEIEESEELDDVVSKIIDFEAIKINPKEVFKEYANIFDTYYNSEFYIKKISKIL